MATLTAAAFPFCRIAPEGAFGKPAPEGAFGKPAPEGAFCSPEEDPFLLLESSLKAIERILQLRRGLPLRRTWIEQPYGEEEICLLEKEVLAGASLPRSNRGELDEPPPKQRGILYWGNLLEPRASASIERLRREGSRSLDDFITTFDEELKAKDQKIRALEQEIQRLSFASQRITQRLSGGSRDVLLESEGKDLYQGERFGIIVDALKRELNASEVRSRRYQAIQDLLACNPVAEDSERDILLRELKQLLQAYTSMSPEIR